MKKEQDGQVALSKLVFTHNWEDPAMDEKALRINENDTLFTITSGGCNTLGFLRFNPNRIYCVDINNSQIFLMELKQAAFRNLDYDELLAFFGVCSHPNRRNVYLSINRDLSKEAGIFWEEHMDIIKKGIIMNGRYERFVKIAGWLLRAIQGSSRTEKFFRLNTLGEQQTFYINEWDNGRWKWIFKTMFNKKRLAKKGLDTDYFHFDDGSSSFSESFQQRAAHVMCDIPVQDNYFLSLYFLGHYINHVALPAYLKPENFSRIKSNIDRIIPVIDDGKYWLENQSENMFDAMALSNICELMDDTDTHKLFSEVLRTSKPNARLIFRNLMIPREVPDTLRLNIIKDEELSKNLQYYDRSFVYGKVAAYNILK